MNDSTILVVDDEPQIRRVLRSTLSSSGYDVIEAKDGQEAVEMVIRERPDLILMDVNMPVMNGLEACRKIRLSFDGPIIMVTVRNSEHGTSIGPSISSRVRFNPISASMMRSCGKADRRQEDGPQLGT